MQYWQRRLQRSVTDSRRLRSGRPKRSSTAIDSPHYPRKSAILGDSALRRIQFMRRTRLVHVVVATAVLVAAPVASNQPGLSATPAAQSAPSGQDDAKADRLKAEAV